MQAHGAVDRDPDELADQPAAAGTLADGEEDVDQGGNDQQEGEEDPADDVPDEAGVSVSDLSTFQHHRGRARASIYVRVSPQLNVQLTATLPGP